ncbi:MAG: hypothetical protein OXK19_08280 [Candidatus Dadabacteria bacterium]|nr:hypothetical protein [Candidatus Dadabacteria bacterium]
MSQKSALRRCRLSADRIRMPERRDEQRMVLSHLTMRRAVGTLGVLLPFMLIVGSIINRCPLRLSISSFYYAPMPINGLFIGVLCAIGVFLICYKGHKARPGERVSDDQAAYAAGVGVILLAIFPMCCDSVYCSFRFSAETLSTVVHYFGAVLFFASIYFMVLYKFTKTYNKEERERYECGKCNICNLNHEWKNSCDKVYEACAYTILICLALLILNFLLTDILKKEYFPRLIDCLVNLKENYSSIFWVESVAVWAFGIAWFIKGEKDKKCEKKSRNSHYRQIDL